LKIHRLPFLDKPKQRFLNIRRMFYNLKRRQQKWKVN